MKGHEFEGAMIDPDVLATGLEVITYRDLRHLSDDLRVHGQQLPEGGPQWDDLRQRLAHAIAVLDGLVSEHDRHKVFQP